MINPATVIDCDDEVFTTEREAMKEHGLSNGAYYVQRRTFRQSQDRYNDIAAVTVVQAMKEHVQLMNKHTAIAVDAAKFELRKAEQGLYL